MKEKKKTTVKTTNKKVVAASTNTSAKCLEMKCSKYYGIMRCMLNTPYNWSIVFFTLIIWYLTSFVAYYSASNFDMLMTLHNYIQLLSLVAIIIGLLRVDNKQYMRLTRYGITAYLLSILTIVFARNALLPTNFLSDFALKPASIFFFLMTIKKIWNIAADCKK